VAKSSKPAARPISRSGNGGELHQVAEGDVPVLTTAHGEPERITRILVPKNVGLLERRPTSSRQHLSRMTSMPRSRLQRADEYRASRSWQKPLSRLSYQVQIGRVEIRELAKAIDIENGHRFAIPYDQPRCAQLLDHPVNVHDRQTDRISNIGLRDG
jgi:hypothetical protein